MRSSPPALLPVFRSDLQGRLLALLFANPETERTLADLASRLGAPVSTVHREVSRLVRADVLADRNVGRSRIVRPDLDSPYAAELGALVLKVYGPIHVLARVFARVAGIEEAYLYGSWAARFQGIRGPAPGDIDVLLVGDPNPDAVFRSALEAEKELGLEVNVVTRSPAVWTDATEGFARTVRSGPLVRLDLHGQQ